MKNRISLFLALIIATTLSAKKVKFAVDMRYQVVMTTGVHLSGDFQVLAGYATDWCSNCTMLTKETADTNIYSIILDIPAFAKYEYRFLNGDQFYETEFVPIPSRVNYSFNDNRWFYLDSLANDTTLIGDGATLFGTNAPLNLTLVRYYVDMQNEVLDPNGAHVAGNFQSWDPSKLYLYHFIDAPTGVHEIITHVTTGTYEHKFYNGNTVGTVEIVPGPCNVNSNRSTDVLSDTMLTTVCFSGCTACIPVASINEIYNNSSLHFYPNPMNNSGTLEFKQQDAERTVVITDILGKMVRTYEHVKSTQLNVNKENLRSGIYFINVLNSNNSSSKTKLIVE